MSGKVFTSQESFKGLQEAIDSISCFDDDDYFEMVVIPPDPRVLSDEEEGFVDDMTLSTLPKDVLGAVEVVLYRENSENSDDSDYEPLVSKRIRKNFARHSNSMWRKCNPSHSSTSTKNSEVLDRVNDIRNELKNLNPVQIFEKMFDQSVFDLIICSTNIYAKQNNRHDFQLNISDLKKFLGILILTGYRKVPREPMYWSLDEDVSVDIVPKALSRLRFCDIKRNFHLVDNSIAATTNDKLFKVRPLADVLMKNFLQWGVFHDSISVDESMIKYDDHFLAEQFIRGKPFRFGYKNWVATSSTGYCYSFDLYSGKSHADSHNSFGLKNHDRKNTDVDGAFELDQSISLYRIAIHGSKWWWVLFTYMLDVAIANSWRLHVLSNENPMDQLTFRRHIACYYLLQSDQNKSRKSEGLLQDADGHYPTKIKKQLRCVVCHSRIRWQCKKGLKTLCVEKQCFEKFHT